jgi:hypothetical protein
METSLNDPDQYEKAYSTSSGLQVTAPLLQCVERLKEKLASISKLHKERFEEVKSRFLMFVRADHQNSSSLSNPTPLILNPLSLKLRYHRLILIHHYPLHSISHHHILQA